MPELVIPSRLFNPRTVLGVDENNDFRVVIVDTDGHPQVDVPDLDFDAQGRLRVVSEAEEVGYVLLRDKKTAGTNGGTFTSGGWERRELTEEWIDTADVCSLSGNDFTLQPGIYDFDISCPAIAVQHHQARLYNVTDANVVAVGTNGSSSAGGGDTTLSLIRGRFEITYETTFRVQHRCQTTVANVGRGVQCGWNEEIYTVVELWIGRERVVETYDYVQLRDKKASTSDGGTFTTGVYRTRDLTEELFDSGAICSLAANEFTLLAGTYFFDIICPAIAVNGHQARLYNITDAAVALLGTNSSSDSAGGDCTYSIIKGRVSITATKTFKVQHQGSATCANVGFGTSMDWGDEIYTVMECYRVAE